MRYGLEDLVGVHDSHWRVVFTFRGADGEISGALRTLFLQEMIRRGVLFQGLYLPCYTHEDTDIERIIAAFEGSCEVYCHALEAGVEDLLEGPVIPPVFRKYNNYS